MSYEIRELLTRAQQAIKAACFDSPDYKTFIPIPLSPAPKVIGETEYREGVCCAHTWTPRGASRQKCSLCGAACKRDLRGFMIEYATPAATRVDHYRDPTTGEAIKTPLTRKAH